MPILIDVLQEKNNFRVAFYYLEVCFLVAFKEEKRELFCSQEASLTGALKPWQTLTSSIIQGEESTGRTKREKVRLLKEGER